MKNNNLFEKSAAVFKKDGLGGFFRKFKSYLTRELNPLTARLEPLFYWYAKKKIARTTNKKFSAETAAGFLFDGSGHFITPKQVRSEITSLAKVVEELEPKVVVEIGTARGGTLFLWSRLARPDASIISIDLPWEVRGGYPPNRKSLYEKFAGPAQTLTLARADSHLPETFAELTNRLAGQKIDFLFIDGDHTYEGVKKDYEQYSPLVRPGGALAFHDVAWNAPGCACEVYRFWDEVKIGKNYRELIEDPNQGWGGIGVIYV